jgi:release factor glutamine methyltransferase
MSNHTLDYIVINPPYYPKKPKNIKEQAWFCGENFEYFEKLFLQLPNFLSEKTKCYMILSQDCDIEKIKALALKNAIVFDLILEKKELVETNYIFRLTSL